MLAKRPLPFPPDTRADISRIVAVILRSSWLAIAVVAVVLGVSVWLLLRARRSIVRQTSLHFILNSIVVITVLILVLFALATVNILIEPAAALQAFFGVWCLPPPQATAAILVGVCVVVTIVETLAAKARVG